MEHTGCPDPWDTPSSLHVAWCGWTSNPAPGLPAQVPLIPPAGTLPIPRCLRLCPAMSPKPPLPPPPRDSAAPGVSLRVRALVPGWGFLQPAGAPSPGRVGWELRV